MIEGDGFSPKRRVSPQERLIHNAAELPTLDPHLRRRVLDAALTAHTYGRFKHWVQLSVAAMLLVGCGFALTGYYLALWRGEPLHPPQAVAHQEDQKAESESPTLENRKASFEDSPNPNEKIPEWSLVEDSFSHRKRNAQTLKSALWD